MESVMWYILGPLLAAVGYVLWCMMCESDYRRR